jgi:putative endopeptidase
MVKNIEFALGQRIDALSWMSPATKTLARAKLDSIVQKIGYPDKWIDYSALKVSATAPFITNYFASVEFGQHRQFAKIGKPVDRGEWGITPPTVDAYYNATNNDINFPAGILQPPFFDANADDAANYGAIGAVIGHEITHGFDDEGRQFDGAGNLRDWWTKEDAASYTTLAQRDAAQYSSYIGVDTLHVNGQLTLGENIADLGGLTVAYYAYQHSLDGKPAPPVVHGLTGDQRFFVAFGQVWRRKSRPEADRLRILTDPHSPAYWRVNGVVVNMPEFAKAFGCKLGDKMFLPSDQRAQIW